MRGVSHAPLPLPATGTGLDAAASITASDALAATSIPPQPSKLTVAY